MNSDSHQDALECLLRSGIEHLWSDGGRIGIPRYKDQFGCWTAIIRFKFHIDETVATIIYRQFGNKVVIGGLARPLLFNDNGLLIRDVVYEVTKLEISLLEFKLGKCVANVVANDDSCGLFYKGRVRNDDEMMSYEVSNKGRRSLATKITSLLRLAHWIPGMTASRRTRHRKRIHTLHHAIGQSALLFQQSAIWPGAHMVHCVV